MSCDRSHQLYRTCVNPGYPDLSYDPWGGSSSHPNQGIRPPLLPSRESVPLWKVQGDESFLNRYTERDWQAITTIALSLMDVVMDLAGRRYFAGANLESLRLLGIPLSGMNDPRGTVARRMLAWPIDSEKLDDPTLIPDLAQTFAHAWYHPVVRDDLIRWCHNLIDHKDIRHCLVGALVVGHGAEIPEIREHIPDDLLRRTISLDERLKFQNDDVRASYLPVFRSLLTHLFHRQPVSRWVKEQIDSWFYNMLIAVLASIDPSTPVPDHITSLIHQFMTTSKLPTATSMAVQWIPYSISADILEKRVMNEAQVGSERPSIFCALARSRILPTRLCTRLLPLIEGSLPSIESLAAFGRMVGDPMMSRYAFDRITPHVNRLTEDWKYGFPTQEKRQKIRRLIKSYASVASNSAFLDPQIIDAVLEYCRQHYDDVSEESATTLGAFLEFGSVSAAEQALHICQSLILPWKSGNKPLLDALFRGIGGPCADAVTKTLLSLTDHPDICTDMIIALSTLPFPPDRNQEKIGMAALNTIMIHNHWQYIEHRGDTIIPWMLQRLPRYTVLAALEFIVRSHKGRLPGSMYYPIVGLLVFGTDDQRRDAWRISIGRNVSVDGDFDKYMMLNAWLWGCATAPREHAPWLMHCIRKHPVLRSVLP